MAAIFFASSRRQDDPMHANMQANESLKKTSSLPRSSGEEQQEYKLAECGKQLRSGILEKKIAGTVVTWKTQGVVLTDRMICFLNDDGVIEDDETVIDYIPLHEVVQLMMEGENKSEREEKLCLIIRTVEGGHNSGRTYVYRMKTEAECLEWHKDMSTGLKLAMKAKRQEQELQEIGDSKYLWLRFKAKKLIKARTTHIVMSVLILLNFFVDVYEAESLPEASSSDGVFVRTVGILVTAFFTVEVSVAAFAMSENHFKPFYSDPWNIMDLMVRSLIEDDHGPGESVFQIMTGDSWASSVSRTLFDEVGPDDAEAGNLNRRVALFSISYVIIATIILVNIVVAVLLDEFISSVTREKEEQARLLQEQRELEAKASRISGVLDPLLVSISSFNDNVDLSSRIKQLYAMLDADGGGGLDFHELNAGLKQLPLPTPIHLTLDDYDIITEGGNLCKEDGEFDADQFQSMMKGELKRYAQRCVANAMSETERKEDHSILFMLKLLTMTVDEIHAGMKQMEKQQAEVEGVGEKVERMCKELGDQISELRGLIGGAREAALDAPAVVKQLPSKSRNVANMGGSLNDLNQSQVVGPYRIGSVNSPESQVSYDLLDCCMSSVVQNLYNSVRFPPPTNGRASEGGAPRAQANGRPRANSTFTRKDLDDWITNVKANGSKEKARRGPEAVKGDYQGASGGTHTSLMEIERARRESIRGSNKTTSTTDYLLVTRDAGPQSNRSNKPKRQLSSVF
ncbi:hypothetical protein GUITHDRAFT_122197 [Guillardia theta CCMP2712]|uniref:EF-hand domain-containing protein n=2 Tax=Guillardia theta (strain CCMP2712) TaxID=905079 RepID=L1I6W7_GUITC|nr:hypothetical protein GUITHDRAFT_122197 [Guillardia theta CCMP2712]EKX31615.1 hypothetical protein GUITHDRAFT_122197 [Guillardia theta CCMP2712]|eukprot:XP_005818595.1 hypothetical protein GUITHDRAFT_122197 [Guillardia theta CCMP2712]